MSDSFAKVIWNNQFKTFPSLQVAREYARELNSKGIPRSSIAVMLCSYFSF